MNKIIIVFLVFLFGVMAGYGWQNYHHRLTVEILKKGIAENQQDIEALQINALRSLKEIKSYEKTIQIILCESSGRYDVWGDGGKSYGPAQFQEKTFNWMKKEAGWPRLQWKNPDHQVWLLRWALKNEYGGHWTCYHDEKKKT